MASEEEFMRVVYGVERSASSLVSQVEGCGINRQRAVTIVDQVRAGIPVDDVLGLQLNAAESANLTTAHQLRRMLAAESTAPGEGVDVSENVPALHTAMRALHGSGVSEYEARARLDALRTQAVREGVPRADFGQVVATECARLRDLATRTAGRRPATEAANRGTQRVTVTEQVGRR